MQYPLHPKWEGVWEIRGNSRWNGERMVIVICNNKECVLTDPNSMEEYTLTAEPTSDLRAHWDFRSQGKAQRYYIGTLLKSKNYNEIEWSEMRKKRKTDKWIRITPINNLTPIQYLKKYKSSSKRKNKHFNNNTNKRIIRRNNHNNNNNNNDIYSQSAPSLPKYVPKNKNNNNQQINDPAIMNMGNSFHSTSDLDQYKNNSQRFPPIQRQPKYQTQHKPTSNNQYYAEYYPNANSRNNNNYHKTWRPKNASNNDNNHNQQNEEQEYDENNDDHDNHDNHQQQQRSSMSNIVCVTDNYRFNRRSKLASYIGDNQENKQIHRLPGYEQYESDQEDDQDEEDDDDDKNDYNNNGNNNNNNTNSSTPCPQHKQEPIPPADWGLVTRLDLQPRLPDQDKHSKHNRHEIHQMKLFRATRYSLPRRTKLRHQQVHEPRHINDKRKFEERRRYQIKGSDNGNRAKIIDGYLDNDSKRYQSRDNKERRKIDRGDGLNRNNRRDNNKFNDRDKDRKRQKRRDRNRFSRHITKEECDKIMQETKDFKNPIMYIGEISISRFNPNVCYVSVPGTGRDIRISGFVDRNRAFHGDKVIVTIYPECEWMLAIKPEITAFQNVLDERDRNRNKIAIQQQQDEEEEDDEDDDLNQVIYDQLKKKEESNYNASSSSAYSEEDQEAENENDGIDENKEEKVDDDKKGKQGGKRNEDEDEIIYFDDSDSENKKKDKVIDDNKGNDDDDNDDNDDVKKNVGTLEQEMEKLDISSIEKIEDDEVTTTTTTTTGGSGKKWRKKDKGGPTETKTNKALFKKARKRFEELNDSNSITAYDQYLFLKANSEDFKKFEQKWPDLSLLDDNHPRREYIDKVIEKCGGKLPSEALNDFAWNAPSDHLDKIPRGKVIGIYSENKRSRESIPGFILPLIYNCYGEIDRKWALFTPDDKRYPKANFPLRELPKSLKELFKKFEKEEIEIVEEYENRKYDLQKQGFKYKDIENNKMIKKRTNKYNEELKLYFFNMKFEDKWPDHYFMPVCHLIKDSKNGEIGRRGAVEVETKVILSRHNITWNDKFSKEIENYVKDFKIDSEKDYIGRRDCRSIRVFTIDPTSARDFDDALSIEELKGEFDDNGNKLYKIGIHIADVTHFVKEGSPVDKEAKYRATSVYLVDRCLPMLPHHLCQNLCSLNPDVDRLAYSVFVILNEKGHLINRKGSKDDPYSKSPWFGKTVIRSRARLNYETAHWMLIDKVTKDTLINDLDDCCKISSDTTLEEIINDTKLFWMIAKQMRERRFNSGSVQFFRPHIRFRLDKKDQHKALVFGPEILLSSNNLIEEMMLLANQLVANELISKIKEHTLLRKHPSPLQEKGMKLQLICRSQDMNLKFDTPKHLNESLIEMQKKTYGGINAAQVINALLAQAMMRAQYIIVEDQPETEWSHWALNFPIYTHFTSPIRRYADVIVHRLLSYTIFNDGDNQTDDNDIHKQRLPSINEMKVQCEICNDRNASAHFAEIDSQTIHLCLVLIDHPIIVDTMLIDLYSSYFILVVPGLGLDIRVNINDTIKESNKKIISINKEYELPDSQLCIKWRNGDEEIFKLFDKMRVRLSSKLKTPIKIITSIIEPERRKYLKPANADAINDDHDDNDEEKQENEQEQEQEQPDDEVIPVAMTLDQQLKVGTCDYYAAHYD